MDQGTIFSDLPRSQLSDANVALNSVVSLDIQLQQKLISHSQLLQLDRNAFLFSQDESADAFYLILSGAFKLVKSQGDNSSVPAESSTLIEVVGPGDLIAAALMQNATVQSVYPVSAKAMMKSKVLRFSKTFYHQDWLTEPALFQYAQTQMLKKISRMQKDRCLQRMSLEQRVAYFLTEKVGSIAQLKITRQDIADAIGASQEAVIRLLSQWKSDGWIETRDHHIQLLAEEKIKSLWQKF